MRLNKYKSSILFLALLFLTGCCTNIPNNLSDLMSNASEFVSEAEGIVSDYVEENSATSPHEYAVNTFNEVFELVQEKDTQAIFNMFSDYVRENVDIMPDIEKLVEYMDGNVIEMRHVGASNSYSTIRNGETTSAAYTASTYVTTDNGTLYWVKAGVITADEDETKLGLNSIYILNCDIQNEYTKEWDEWNKRRKNGAKEDEPQKSENYSVKVNY